MRGLGLLVCGTRKSCEGARLRRLLTVVGDVAVGEQGGSSWIIDGYPRHECLDESNVPALVQKEQASLRVVHGRVCAGVGEDEPKQFCAIVQPIRPPMFFWRSLICSSPVCGHIVRRLFEASWFGARLGKRAM